jgi:hypothetical protein
MKREKRAKSERGGEAKAKRAEEKKKEAMANRERERRTRIKSRDRKKIAESEGWNFSEFARFAPSKAVRSRGKLAAFIQASNAVKPSMQKTARSKKYSWQPACSISKLMHLN